MVAPDSSGMDSFFVNSSTSALRPGSARANRPGQEHDYSCGIDDQVSPATMANLGIEGLESADIESLNVEHVGIRLGN